MKKTLYITAVLICCVLALAGCRKDNVVDGILLTAETFTTDGTKTSVNGNQVHWVDEDEIRINGKTATVDVDGTRARATGISESDLESDIRGYYPAAIITATGASGENTDSPTIIFPRRYSSSFSDGRQVIGLPMVGRADANSNTIFMKHVSAAINVRIKNSTGRDKLYVDSVIVSSADKQLCGAASVTLASDADPVVAGSDNVPANRSVTVYFDNPVLISGDYLEVQVPILPVASGGITFKVYTHVLASDIYPGVSKAHHSYDYSRELTNGALGRNVLGIAQIAVTAASTYVNETDRGLFTINASGKQVRIAHGNLQYTASSNTWSFAEKQYIAIGNAAGNNYFGADRATQSNPIDLFGWGTSGWDNGNDKYMPYDNDKSAASDVYGYGYGPRTKNSAYLSLTGDYAEADWGVHNRISNGGNEEGLWRTLTSDEWTRLLSSRDASTINGVSNARYAKANVNGINGLIIFPDEYSQPNGVTLPTAINTTGSGGCTGNIYSDSDWSKMEAAGAVFLPVTGRTEVAEVTSTSAGYYWSTTFAGTSNNYRGKAFYMNFANMSLNASIALYRYYGCAVRLVKNMY